MALLAFEVIETDRALLVTALAVGCFATATFLAVSLHLTDGQLLSLGDHTFRFTETEQERFDRAKSAKVQMAVAPIMPILIAVLYAVEPEIVPRSLVWVFCGLSIWIIIFSYLKLRMSQPRSPAY